ncbi:MAG: cobalamin-dependent protein [Candidatus Coatesbacteria bacterium]
MKVLLVTPPYHSGVVESAGRWMPLGLAYLAGAVRRAGHEVEIYDAMTKFHGMDEVRARLAASRPDVIGITAITASYPAALRVLAAAKEILPGVVTVVGGVHTHFLWREALEGNPGTVDYVVRGEGEQALPGLLACLAAGGDPRRVAGVACRDGATAVAAPLRPLLSGLEDTAPAWDLVEWPDYTYFPFPGSRLAAVSTSRGCSQGCSFCSQQKFWTRAWRGRAPEAVIAELEHLRDAHGVTVALFADECPTTDAGRWEALLRLAVKRRLGLRLLIESRVEDVVRDAPLIDLYREAGIIHVYVGVEATTQAALDRFNKNLRVDLSAQALRLIAGAGMISETSFVLGMPEETPDTVAATLKLAREYDPDFAHFLMITPWPYAEIAAELEPYIESRDFSDYNLVTPVARSAAMTRSELEAAMVECYRKFYMGKLPRWASSPAGFRKDYILTSMRLIMKSSFLRRYMGGLGTMPAEIERFFRAPVP